MAKNPTKALAQIARAVAVALLVTSIIQLPVVLAGAASAQNTLAADATARANEAVLITQTGKHLFSVEIADDPVERARGLMFRQSMARDHGMLFDFGDEAPRAFWMKNTPLPLDIIFIDSTGKVVSIAKDTTPFSTDSIPSSGPARFVFEVNSGVADDISLAPGDQLLHLRVVN